MAISLVLRCAVLAALLNAASGLLLKPQPPRSISRRSALAGGLVAVVSLPVQAAKEPTAEFLEAERLRTERQVQTGVDAHSRDDLSWVSSALADPF